MSEADAASSRGGQGGSDAVNKGKQAKSGKGAGDGDRPGLFSRLALFYRQVIAELRKVIWPTRKELITYSYVVIVFVTVLALIIAALDLVFARAVLTVFGGRSG